MREQAHLIQGEVIRLMEDVARVDERVRKLQVHFGQSAKDIDDILVSTSKVTKRGQKIEALEFGVQPAEDGTGAASSAPLAKAEGGARVAEFEDRTAQAEGCRRRRLSRATAPPRWSCLEIPAANAAPSGAISAV